MYMVLGKNADADAAAVELVDVLLDGFAAPPKGPTRCVPGFHSSSRPSQPRGPAHADAKLDALVDKADLIYRGTSSAAVFSMHIKTKAYERDYEIVAWDDGRRDRTLDQDPRAGAVARVRHAQDRREPQALRSQVEPRHRGRPVDARRQLDGESLLQRRPREGDPPRRATTTSHLDRATRASSVTAPVRSTICR